MKSINSAIKATLLVAVVALQLGSAPPVDRVYSQLWGQQGESWDTTKLPDFTTAGYRSGAAAIPDFPEGAAVTDFGAVADGTTDNTEAFRKAIAACGPNQSVYVPSGTYLLSDTLVINKSNISLTSNASNPAVLFFDKGLEELHPSYDAKGIKKTEWSWSGGVITFSGKVSNVGVSNLNLVFTDSAWTGHNFHERGYNGIGFTNGAHDGWIKHVTITGADVGIWIAAKAHHITTEDCTLRFGPVRGAKKVDGHHGLVVYGGFNLFENFKIEGRFQHDITVSGTRATYNVFRAGSFTDLCIDHHNHNPSKNLFTNLDAGAGTRLYASGGKEKPRGVCFEETFWNINAARDMGYPDEKDDPDLHCSNNVCVGIRTGRASVLGDLNSNWFETIAPADLYPQDLYLAQLQYLKNR